MPCQILPSICARLGVAAKIAYILDNPRFLNVNNFNTKSFLTLAAVTLTLSDIEIDKYGASNENCLVLKTAPWGQILQCVIGYHQRW